jgi:hypothetical protein
LVAESLSAPSITLAGQATLPVSNQNAHQPAHIIFDQVDTRLIYFVSCPAQARTHTCRFAIWLLALRWPVRQSLGGGGSLAVSPVHSRLIFLAAPPKCCSLVSMTVTSIHLNPH